MKKANRIDEDENVNMMRETAQEIGLTRLLVQVYRSYDRRLLLKALRLLGVSFVKGNK